jgi:hypothetical protein
MCPFILAPSLTHTTSPNRLCADPFLPCLALPCHHPQVSPHARTKDLASARYISILNIIQGEVDPTQVGQGNQGKYGLGFVWGNFSSSNLMFWGVYDLFVV